VYAGCVVSVMVSLFGVYKMVCLFTRETAEVQSSETGSPEPNPRHRNPDLSIRCYVRPQAEDEKADPFVVAERYIVRNMVVLSVEGPK